MLCELHVKNLALIEEEDIVFTEGLNILTGETGAGKSILLGSVGLALGAKADKNMIRSGADFALVELTFLPDSEQQLAKLRSLELPLDEDGTILVKRKIWPGRNACTVCGESVTLHQLREIGEMLINVYGQRENVKLLRRENQLETLDEFGGEEIASLRSRTAEVYRNLSCLKSEWEENDLDESARKRELDLCEYEIREIEDAGLRAGEDEELEERFRILGNAEKLSSAAAAARMLCCGDENSAADLVARAVRELGSVQSCDPKLEEIAGELSEIDSLLSDFGRTISDYEEEMVYDPEEFSQITDRLNLINHLKDKYGRTIELVLQALEERQQRSDELSGYAQHREKLQREIDIQEKKLAELAEKLSQHRKAAASHFAQKMEQALLDLNFNHVVFEIHVEEHRDRCTAKGWDDVRFYISMNPGMAPGPLDEVASGGELSRIMLGMKTVFAGRDEIGTFIFDEIDSGISGKTAWKVAEKLGKLSADHQILCITHLPQIAAMEDSHFLIAKEVKEGTTVTHISRLDEEGSAGELARLLGTGDDLTDAALVNAAEMKRMARREKGLEN